MAKKRPHGFTEEYIHQKTEEAFHSLDYSQILALTEKFSEKGCGGQVGTAIHLFLKQMEQHFDMTEEESAYMLIGGACAMLAADKEKKRMASSN